jgi:hypothetical protein
MIRVAALFGALIRPLCQPGCQWLIGWVPVTVGGWPPYGEWLFASGPFKLHQELFWRSLSEAGFEPVTSRARAGLTAGSLESVTV